MSDRLIAFLVFLVFCLCLGPMVLRHNEDIGVVTAVFIDSGSMLSGFISMAGPPVDLNQNVQYHAGIYGWTYNTIVTVGIAAINLFSKLAGTQASFSAYALWSRSVSLIFTAGGLAAFYLLLRSFSLTRLLACVLLLATALFPPLVKLAYEIHPESAGFFCAVFCLFCIKKFADTQVLKTRYLYLAWVFSVAAVMSKQSFMMYLLIPVGMAVFKSFAGTASFGVKTANLFKLGAGFAVSGLAMVLVFHPYSLLHPLEFLAKQESIRSFHSTMYLSLGESAERWFFIALKNDYWMLLAALLSVGRLCFNRFRGSWEQKCIDLCSLALLLSVALYVLELRFYFFRSYLYPLLPLSVIPLIGIARKFGTIGSVVLGALFASAIPFYALHTAGAIHRDLMLEDSVGFEVREKFTELGPREWSVIHSPSLPLSSGLFKAAVNSFAFDPKSEDFLPKLRAYSPDVMIIDKSFEHDSPELLEKGAKAIGLQLVAGIDGENPTQWLCLPLQPLSVDHCLNAVEKAMGEEPEPGEIEYSRSLVYARPELAVHFRTN